MRLVREAAGPVALGLLTGLSGLGAAYFDRADWGVLLLIALAVLVAAVVMGSLVPSGPGLAAVGGLTALWAWSLISTSWAESTDQALTHANRWLLYAAFLAVALAVLGEGRRSGWLLGAVVTGLSATGVVMVGMLLAGSGEGLFFAGRLDEPLGYINGQAAFFLMALWPLLALASTRPARVAGPALSVAVLLGGLVLLTQTRAALPVLLFAGAVFVVAGHGRTRRAWALVVAVLALLVVSRPLNAPYVAFQQDGALDPATLPSAALALLLAAGVAGALWAAGTGLAGRVERRWPSSPTAAAWGLALVLAASVTGAALKVDDPLSLLRDRTQAFRGLSTDSSSTSRLLSAGGNRFDYWRIAVRQFTDHPIRGIGAGGFDRTYYLERRTTESVTQPHSLPLQVAGELGLVGLVGLLTIAGAVAFAAVRVIRQAPHDTEIVAGAAAIVTAWAVHTSVDWLHLLPGVTFVALSGAAVLLAAAGRSAGRTVAGTARTPPPRRLLLLPVGTLIAAAAIALIGAASTARLVLADRSLERAQERLESDPVGALEAANQALAYEASSLPSHYLKAAALARLGTYEESRAALLRAVELEPHDHVSWVLLGDLATRRGDRDQAVAAYERALALNPRDQELRGLLAASRRPAG